MKIETTREALLKPLQQVIGAATEKSNLPILSHIYLKATDNSVEMRATDLQMQLETTAEIECNRAGITTLPAKKLFDILKALPPQSPVTLTLGEEDKAILKSGRSRVTLRTLPPDDFPVLKQRYEEESNAPVRIALPQSQLKILIARTKYAIAIKDVRYYLNGLLFEYHGDKFAVVATDGHRLAYSESAIDGDARLPFKIIIPDIAVNQLYSLLSDSDDLVQLHMSDHQLQASIGATAFTTNLIDGKFPDYTRVIPRYTSPPIVINRDAFRGVVQRVGLINDKPTDGIHLHFGKNAVRATAKNYKAEDAEDELELDFLQADITIGFNPKYLIDAINALSGDLLTITLGDDSTQSAALSDAMKNGIHIIMPMRI